MRFTRIMGSLVCLALMMVLPAWATTSKTTKSTRTTATKKKLVSKGSVKKSKRLRARKGAWKRRGQQTITSDRTVEIQEALIREGYLNGAASGEMDQRTKAALMRLQQENGWQTRIVPDSRALIKLGLGPKHDNLINPNTAAYSTATDLTGASAGSQR